MIDVKVALGDLSKIIANVEVLKRQLVATQTELEYAKLAGDELRVTNTRLRNECHRMGVKLDYYSAASSAAVPVTT